MTRTRRVLVTSLFATLLAGFLTVVAAASAQAAITVYPVPTSAASLGRIVTAPDGNMWFIEKDVNKVARITPSGQISEFVLPPISSPDVRENVKDLDIAPDGTVWVVYNHGREAIALNPDGSVKTGPVSLGGSPYGEEIRVTADGTPWITMSFDEDFIAWIQNGQAYASTNSPECDGALGIGVDGTRWCQQWDKLVKVNPAGDGGVTYPLPPNASYPYSLSPGPVGSIWYARHFSGTWISSPSRGSIGYLDAQNAAVTDINTGDKTAPASLVRSGNRMWFTSIGAEPAIGHYDVATGQGAITKVGNYAPEWLTVGSDGAIWATDAKNNSIIRVTTDELMTTNINVGAGSQIAPHPTPPVPTPTPGPQPGTGQVGQVKAGKKPLPVKKGTVQLPVACPASSAGGCQGTARIRVGKKVITKARNYSVAAGKKTVVKLKVTRKGMGKLKRNKPTKATAELTAPGAKKPAVTKGIKLRRR